VRSLPGTKYGSGLYRILLIGAPFLGDKERGSLYVGYATLGGSYIALTGASVYVLWECSIRRCCCSAYLGERDRFTEYSFSAGRCIYVCGGG
jgi:hypothetical protein